MAPGPARRAAEEALRAGGLEVATAPEPYEATALFVERPADLVVLDLGGRGTRDPSFLRALRKRAPAARILLLLPEGRRRAAVAALEAGADAYVLDPFHPVELTAVALGLLRAGGGAAATAGAPEALVRLAGEVAHAVNNPLQVLSLLGEDGGIPDAAADSLQEHVERIRDVVGILAAFGRLGPPAKAPCRLGKIVKESLEARAARGTVKAAAKPPEDGPRLEADADQLREALGAVLGLLEARGGKPPVRVAAHVRAVGSDGSEGAEVELGVDGLEFPEAEFRSLLGTVLLSHEETRRCHPGLLLPATVAAAHGGSLVARASPRGTALTLRFPV
jgi:CheY-like chemotaxis protein